VNQLPWILEAEGEGIVSFNGPLAGQDGAEPLAARPEKAALVTEIDRRSEPS
jgi:hypothetical protein